MHGGRLYGDGCSIRFPRLCTLNALEDSLRPSQLSRRSAVYLGNVLAQFNVQVVQISNPLPTTYRENIARFSLLLELPFALGKESCSGSSQGVLHGVDAARKPPLLCRIF